MRIKRKNLGPGATEKACKLLLSHLQHFHLGLLSFERKNGRFRGSVTTNTLQRMNDIKGHLICKQNTWNRLSVWQLHLQVDLLLPFCHGFKGIRPSNVINGDASRRLVVKYLERIKAHQTKALKSIRSLDCCGVQHEARS